MKHTSTTVREWLGYLTQAEIDELKRLAGSIKRNKPVVVNIGAGGGTSGLAFMESREDLTLVTIDITDESSPMGCLEGERQVFESAGYGDLLNVRWFQVHGDSKEVAKHVWQKRFKKKIDMLFIDGGHEYEDCRGDIELFLPHMSKKGIISVHDYKKESMWLAKNPGRMVTDALRYKVIKPWPGVDRAVDEILLSSPEFEHLSTVDSLISFGMR